MPANKKRFGVPDGKSTITARKIDTRQRIKCFEPRKQIRYIESTSKKRKYYSITENGRKQLKAKKQEWELFSAKVNQVIGVVLFEC